MGGDGKCWMLVGFSGGVEFLCVFFFFFFTHFDIICVKLAFVFEGLCCHEIIGKCKN